MAMRSGIRGLMAALPTPRRPDGSVDLEGLERVARLALSGGARGIVPCGGTGEYFDLLPSERRKMLETVLPLAPGQVVVGVGAATLRESVDLAHHGLRTGASAVLLPPPHFFRYGEDELRQFFREGARAIGGPTLLYNLAAFTSPISAELVAELVASEPNVIGIKDSSGSLEILERLTRDALPAVRIQGHDKRLAESLEQGLADGAISGPASVVPEMSAALFDAFGDDEAFAQAEAFNAQFIRQLEKFPYPWALKWVAEWRGLGKARMPFPLGEQQLARAARFREWFDAWLDRLLLWREQRRVEESPNG